MNGSKEVTVNETRYNKFIITYKPKNVDEPFNKKYLNYDSSHLPPCRSELHEHFLRAQYIASIWSNASI